MGKINVFFNYSKKDEEIFNAFLQKLLNYDMESNDRKIKLINLNVREHIVTKDIDVMLNFISKNTYKDDSFNKKVDLIIHRNKNSNSHIWILNIFKDKKGKEFLDGELARLYVLNNPNTEREKNVKGIDGDTNPYVPCFNRKSDLKKIYHVFKKFLILNEDKNWEQDWSFGEYDFYKTIF